MLSKAVHQHLRSLHLISLSQDKLASLAVFDTIRYANNMIFWLTIFKLSSVELAVLKDDKAKNEK